MNERRQLHPVYILFGLLQTIQGFLPIILITLVRGIEWSDLRWYWYAGAGALAIFILVYSFLEWKRFGFWLEEDRIIIRKGLLFRDEKTIYFTRIHSVNVEQPFIQRLLGVAQVKIETPGGNKKAEGVLPALSLKEANHLRVILRGKAEEITQNVVQTDVNEQSVLSSEGSVQVESDFGPIKGSPSFQLNSAQLLMAAATSMNFGLVAAFIAGLYSIANDFIEQMLPDHFFENVVEDSASLASSYLLVGVIIVIGLMFAWLLSIILYILKYSGFAASKDGKQVSVSYGLLEKKTHLFDPKKVQAVIINEGLLRQLFGYAQIQLQVISSDKKEQLMLHPYLKRSDIQKVLNDFVPQLKLPSRDALVGAPKRAWLYYVRIELLLTLAACVSLIAFFKGDGLWSLLLIPLVVVWRKSCYNAAGVKLEDGQLTLQRRTFSRITYLIRRPQMVTMRVKRSLGQQRKELLSLSVHAMGSPYAYRVSCLDQSNVEPIWKWYSRN